MKRILFIIFLILLLALSACGAPFGPSLQTEPGGAISRALPLASEAENYLSSLLRVSQSAILSCDFDAIDEYAKITDPPTLSDVCLYMEEEVKECFDLVDLGETALIDDGMFVFLQIGVDHEGSRQLIDEHAFLAVGAGLGFVGLDEALQGCKKGDEIRFVLSEDGLDGFKAGQEILVIVQRVHSMELKKEGMAQLLKEDGLETALEQFASAFDNAYVRCYLERIQLNTDALIAFALQHSSFYIDPNDLQNAARYFLQKTEKEAAMLQMSLTEYGEHFLELAGGDIFEHIVQLSENKIKEILFVGAASVRGKTALTEEDYREYLSRTSYYPAEEEAEGRYVCLKNLVLGKLYHIPIVLPV